MKVLAVWPAAGPKALGYFDLQIGEHLRIYNLALRRSPDGRLRTVAPKACGKHAATFHPTLGEQISRAAEAALGGLAANVAS